MKNREDFSIFRNAKKLKAIGELGLDYFYDLSDYAKISQLPTKLSDLTQDINYALRSELFTKLSQLENDKGFIYNEYSISGNQSYLSEGVWKFNKLSFPLETQRIQYDINFSDSLGNNYIGIDIQIIGTNTMVVYGKNSTNINIPLYQNENNNFIGNYLAQQDGELKKDYYLIFEENNLYLSNLFKYLNLLTCYNIIKEYETTDFVKKEINNIDFNNNATNDYNYLINKPLLNSIIPDETATNNYRGEEAIWMFTNEDWFELPENFSYPNGTGLAHNFKDSVGNQFNSYQFNFVSDENDLKKMIILGRISGQSEFVEIFNSNAKTGLAYDNDNYYIITSPTANLAITSSLPLVAMVCINKPTFNNGELVASEKYVKEEIAKLVGTAPEKLNTIEELAEAFKENDNILEALKETLPTKLSDLEDDLEVMTFERLRDESEQTQIYNIVSLGQANLNEVNIHGNFTYKDKDISDYFGNSSEAIVDVKELSLYSGVAVPNSGYVENVYFNTDLSVAEVTKLCKKLTLNSSYKYYCLIGTSNTPQIEIYNSSEGADDSFIIRDIRNGKYYWASDDEQANIYWQGTAGWNPNINYPISINKEVLSSQYGNPIATENTLIKDLFSSEPFKKAKENILYRVSGEASGTIVPNTGYVDKVYFNTGLNVEEVVSILSKLIYTQTPFLYYPLYPILFSSDGTPVVFAVNINGNYGINISYDLQSQDNYERIFLSYDSGDGNKAGWYKTECDINKSVISEYSGLPIGFSNQTISQLVSITPFTETTPTLYHLKNGVKYELVSKDELNKTIGDINSILDQLNGEVV